MDRQGKKTLATEARHRIWIKRKVTISDDEGGQTEAWIKNKEVYASVNPIQAKQQYLNKSIGVDATHLIRVRAETDVLETDIIEYDERDFEILTVENIQERGFEKVITCKEKRP